ncbi:outer membrane beta-barrel domain-containing protein [Bdellovibrio bacteriovorus]|uniref:Outer membrane beta-barrel domain-containing protein n=1 Tax=Bdellovibrio bacteriovorus (strain ATCC 15356 / DSM 50701 / NCIMB 9529 / HD100) TaxID=264462 RepID=Q6MHE8_BDEBA|nr:outer membrane beta-barrel domain-containing protein [Bdellovibrio bacteriovorus]AHZ83945.1 hypothetical protein EP01_03155 [Bdellovibrio bacteriovorus]BEV69921.1 hypothetical protein Bb109J_c3341 [Bdellovibrio bacteriovorus]CAE80979.1 hypothetical protein predicted by Glimmer/Critica [Bdellovibrio bacteriovorus HD100]
MTSKAIKLLSLLFCLLLLGRSLEAATIEFSEEELPSESVVPVLDSPLAVKNKLVKPKGRLELGVNAGYIIDEMFFNNVLWGTSVFYHSSDYKAWGIKYLGRMTGLSTYSEQFEGTSQGLDFNKAPAPGAMLLGSYRWTFLYGKLSFSKDLVLPTQFSLEFDLGVQQSGQQNLPLTAAAISHRLYMKRQFALAATYRLLLYQMLDPVSADIGTGTTPSESDFSKKIQISQGLELGLSYLF